VIFQGRFRTVRHKDHAVPVPMPRPLLGHESFLDIRTWKQRDAGAASPTQPLLLVTTPRKTGTAVYRNRFRRQVRMAFLAYLQTHGCAGWVVWIRPARNAPPLPTITLRAIEAQLLLALHHLPSLGTP
jgi:ribonuclease P protein component